MKKFKALTGQQMVGCFLLVSALFKKLSTQNHIGNGRWPLDRDANIYKTQKINAISTKMGKAC